MNMPPPTPEKTQEVFVYFAAVSKGQRMHDITLQVSCTTSIYVYQSQLIRWGWSRSTVTHEDLGGNGYTALITACLKSSGGTSQDINATVIVSDLHHDEFYLDGVKYPFTLGTNFSILNPKAGLPIASVNTTPKKMYPKGQKESEKFKFPKLNHWFDIAFLQWASLGADDVDPDLKFVARVIITNCDTITVLQTVLANLPKKYNLGDQFLPRWPGVTFTMETEEGKTLLGTPNGSGIAWLLAQHKKQLGYKVGKKVQLWYSITSAPNLLFHLKEIEKPEGGDSTTEST
jgi:hypothetical protein